MVCHSVVKHTLDLVESIVIIGRGRTAVVKRRAMPTFSNAAIGDHKSLARQNASNLAEDRVRPRAELQLEEFGACLRPKGAGRQPYGEQCLWFGGEAEAFGRLDIIER